MKVYFSNRRGFFSSESFWNRLWFFKWYKILYIRGVFRVKFSTRVEIDWIEIPLVHNFRQQNFSLLILINPRKKYYKRSPPPIWNSILIKSLFVSVRFILFYSFQFSDLFRCWITKIVTSSLTNNLSFFFCFR